MTSMVDPVLDLEPDFAASLDAELGLLGLLGDGGSASLVAGVADPDQPVPLGFAVGLLSAVDPYALRAIVTGWYDRARSPEARNARPLYHLFGPARSAPRSTEVPPT